ncbi:MAG: hypothetical protein HOO96_28650 [Polyangiaceae bacterium]|nr:hypothetical protein [Polyangiaceae bacterium]
MSEGRASTARWKIAAASLVVLLHAPAAIAVLHLLPQGFPVGHPKFVANTALPWMGLLLGATGVALALRGRARWASGLVLTLALAWASAGVAALVWFPISLPRAPFALLGVGAALGLFAWRLGHLRHWQSVLFAALGIAGGVAASYAQRAEAPSTRPSSVQVEPRGPTGPMGPTGGLSREVGVPELSPELGALDLPCGNARIRVEPLLSFESRSPDRTWTLLAPPDQFGDHRHLDGDWHDMDDVRAWYIDVGTTSLHVWNAGDAIELDARTRLPTDVYAHLDAWTVIRWVSADPGAQIAFSATGDTLFDILPADYPVGRPSRMANLHADGTFRVVQASDGEKGPFHVLGQGPLARDAPLTLRIRTGHGGTCTLDFRDWAAQVSTALSPTAGWGMPQNAIQFFQMSGMTQVFLTLADTGPGRGWDSVGHARGTYRNRIRFTNH